MSNAEDFDDDRDQRDSALARFAAAGEDRGDGPRDLMIPAQAFTGVDRAMGAIKVAVYRDEERVLAKLKALAAAAGEDWYYRYPVKNNKTGKQDWIEGPSIKLANDLARLYGNCDVDVRVVDLGDRWLMYARFQDFETGFSLTRPFVGRKTAARIGGGDDDRRLDISFQIAVSKAQRNVVVNALQTHASYAFDEAKRSLVDSIGKKLPTYRDRVVARLAESGIDLKRAERTRGRVAADWLATDVAALIANIKAVNDGMATWEDTFPPLDQPSNAEATEDAQIVEEKKPSPAAATTTKPTVADFAQGREKVVQSETAASGQPAARVDEKPATAAKVVQQTEAKPTEAKPSVSEKPAGESQAPSGPAAGGGGGQAAASSAPATKPAATSRSKVSDADLQHLIVYAKSLSGKMTSTALQRVGWPGGNWPDEGTATETAIRAIYSVHEQRVGDKLGAADADNRVKEILRGLPGG